MKKIFCLSLYYFSKIECTISSKEMKNNYFEQQEVFFLYDGNRKYVYINFLFTQFIGNQKIIREILKQKQKYLIH